MITVQFTVAKTNKEGFVNIYRSRKFATESSARKFIETLKSKPNVTAIRQF